MPPSSAAAELLDQIREIHARRQSCFEQDMARIDRDYDAQLRRIHNAAPFEPWLLLTVVIMSPPMIIAVAAFIDMLLN
jgi:hypothetical protein